MLSEEAGELNRVDLKCSWSAIKTLSSPEPDVKLVHLIDLKTIFNHIAYAMAKLLCQNQRPACNASLRFEIDISKG